MTLRFHQRHIHKTVANYIETSLATLGWTSTPAPLGSGAFAFLESQPEEEGKPVTVNTIAVTAGNEDADELEELGGGMWSVLVPFFFDVYAEKSSIAVSVAADIKDLMTRQKVIYVKDWTDPANPEISDELLYFEDVIGPEKPPAASVATDFKRHWRVVKAVAHVYYSDIRYKKLTTAAIAASTSVSGALSVVSSLGPSTITPTDHAVDAPYLDRLTGSITYDSGGFDSDGPDFDHSGWLLYYCADDGPATFTVTGGDTRVSLNTNPPYPSVGAVEYINPDGPTITIGTGHAFVPTVGVTYAIGLSKGTGSHTFTWSIPLVGTP